MLLTSGISFLPDGTGSDSFDRSITGCIESQIATLTAYRKSLIHECVTGQRRVTDAKG